jgi:hypothetical protein
MIGLVDALVRGLTGFLRTLHPRNLAKMARLTPLYLPLAVRSVRRRLLRNLLVGLVLGAGIIVYLGLAASFQGTVANTSRRTEPLVLPADVLAFGIDAPNSQPVDSLKWVAPAGAFETFDRWPAWTSLGTLWVVGLREGSRLWSGDGLPSLPAPGEVLVPARVAKAGKVALGDGVKVGEQARSDLVGVTFRVSGFIDGPAAADALLGNAVVMRLDDLLALRSSGALPGRPLAAPNAVAVWEREPGDNDRLLERVADLFPRASVWWPGLPASRALAAAGGFLSPGRVILAAVFVLAGLGVFNVMLLSLLQRKVQLGVVKALGAEDEEVFLLLLLEGVFMAAGGAVLGVLGGSLLIGFLDRASEVPLFLSGSDFTWALVLAAVSFYLAAWLPATLCRRASPIQLMAGRRLYLNPRSTCAQCGRCGGF